MNMYSSRGKNIGQWIQNKFSLLKALKMLITLITRKESSVGFLNKNSEVYLGIIELRYKYLNAEIKPNEYSILSKNFVLNFFKNLPFLSISWKGEWKCREKCTWKFVKPSQPQRFSKKKSFRGKAIYQWKLCV